MQRRSFLKSTSLTAASLALLGKSGLAAFLNDPAYTVKMLTPTMGIFLEKGGTILFRLGKHGVVVVDAQFPETAAHCITAIKEKTEKPFDTLINTHHHGDHTAGNIAFKPVLQKLVAHINSKKNQMAVAEKAKTTDKQFFPTDVYEDMIMLPFEDGDVEMKYFGRGHTDGDSFVYFKKEKMVHVGDLVFNRRHPFVDRTAGANIKEWISTLNQAIAFYPPATKYICGHAGEGSDVVISKVDIELFVTYLSNVLTLTANAKKFGSTKESFLKYTKNIPGSPLWKGDGIERPLSAAWDELSVI